jgi:nitroreductase
MLKELLLKNRSYRRFYEDIKIERKTLENLIDNVRISPSAANNQPLKFIISNETEKNNLIFPCLSWAGYLTDWSGPEKGERPAAYIVILGDTNISKDFYSDPGIAILAILLGASEEGYGACTIASVDKGRLRKDLKIDNRYEILYVIALGKAKERVVLEDTGKDGDIKYWRDNNEVHHVPKRPLNELILE